MWAAAFLSVENHEMAVALFLRASSVVNTMLAILALGVSGMCCIRGERNWFVVTVIVVSALAASLGLWMNL